MLPPATLFLRVHDPKAFGDDVSARRATVVEANKTGKPIVGVEAGRDTLGTLRHHADRARRQEPRRPSMSAPPSARNSSIAPSSASASISPCIGSTARSSSELSSTFGDAVVATPDELKSVFDGAALRRDASLGGHPAALYLGQIKNYAGEPVAVLEVIKDTTEYEAAAASSQRNLIFGTLAHSGRRRAAGVPARPRHVAAAGRDHRRDEPAVERRHRRHHPRRRPQGRTRHHGDGGRRVPPQHDRGRHAARGAGSRQSAGRTGEEGAAAPDGRSLRGRRQGRGRRGRESDQGHAAGGRRDHLKRQRHLGARRRRGRRLRGGLGQRLDGCCRDRGTCLLRGRDRPPGHPFQRRRRRGRGQGRTNHRDGRLASRPPAKRSATCCG